MMIPVGNISGILLLSVGFAALNSTAKQRLSRRENNLYIP